MLVLLRYWRTLLMVALVAAAGAGCTKQFKRSRHLAAGDRDFQAEQYDRAEVEYLNVLKVAPLDPAALSRLGLIYHAEGKVQRAFAFLSKAVEVDPGNITVHLKFGQSCLSFRKFKEARDHALFILGQQPGNDDALLLLADSVASLDALPQTFQLLEGFRQKDKDSSGYHLALAGLALRQNDRDRAEGEVNKALALNPSSSSAYAALGSLFLLRNDLQQAEPALKTAADLAPLRSGRRLAYADLKLTTGSVEDAKQIALDLTRKAPDYIPAYAFLAVIAAAEKHYDDCSALIRKVLARDPANLDALMLNGRILLAKGDLTNAVAQLEQVTSIYGKVPQAKLELGRAYLLNGNAVKGVACLNLAIAGDPNLTDATLLLADFNTQRGNTATAIAALTQLVKQKPQVFPAHLRLAGAYTAQKSYDDALRVLRRMTTSFPPNPRVHYLLGMVLLEQSNETEARQAFENALEVAPGYIPALEQLVNLDLLDKQYAAATGRVSKQLARDPAAADPWLLLAKIHLAQRDTDQAETAFLKAIELKPDLRMPYLLLAQLYVSTQKKQQALQKLNGLVARRTNDVAALMQIGMLQYELKNFSAARDAYEKLLAVNPRSSPALNNLANLCFENFGQLDKACDYARQARALLPADPFAADTLGWLLYQKREYSHALSLCQEAAAKLPGEPEVQFHLGMAYYMLDEPGLALPALQQALAAPKEFLQKNEGACRLALLAIDVNTADAAAVRKLEERFRLVPSDPVALHLLASIYERDGSLDQAVKAYQQALFLNPENARVLGKLAQLYVSHSHDPQKALEMARAARILAPEDPRIAHTLGQLVFQVPDYPWALSLLEESARKLPNEPEVSCDLAWSYYSMGRVPEAEAAMRMVSQAKPAFPKTADVNHFLAMVVAAKTADAASQAAPEAQQLLAADPNYVPALMVSAIAREQQGKVQEAAQFYERVLARYPFFTPAARNLAILYASRFADFSKAYPLALKAREAFPQDPELARTLGILIYRRGDFAGAAQLLKESARKRLDDAELLYYLGLTQFSLKQSEETRTSLQGALALNLSPKLADDARRILAELK